jgi:AraC-like DNA-binding protein
MNFIRIEAHSKLHQFIECYWMMQSEDPIPRLEKIIPDGFTELIFNYGDLYKAKTNNSWHLQTANLLAGQIKSYFYLENTGKTGSVAVKFKPAALTQLFGLNMGIYVDQIIDLDTFDNERLRCLQNKLLPYQGEQESRQILDNYFISLIPEATNNPLEHVLELIFSKNGMLTVNEMTIAAHLGERQLERLFKRYIGLSPKYYARIIRFNYIFQLIKSKKSSWADIVYQSGYYDQSHFIRDFKAFTGEDPSSYYFEASNMANFFLNKST